MTTAASSGSTWSRELVFIDSSDPRDAKSNTQKKAIRSHAARGHHSKKFHVSQGKTHGQQTPVVPEQVERSEKGTGPHTSVFRSTDLKTRVKRPHKPRSKQSRDGVKVDVKKVESPTRTEGNSIVNNQAQPSTQEGHPWMSRGIRTSPFIPFACLEPSQLHIRKLIKHCLYSAITVITETDAGIPFLLHQRWSPLVMTSYANLYVTVLIAVTPDVTGSRFLETAYTRSINLRDLKQATLKSITYEICSSPSGEPKSDSIIGAVARLAGYEATFGTASRYHIHMKGLVRMIRQRGGLESLGFNGLLMSMIQKIDVTSACKLDCKTYFQAMGHLTD